MNRVAGSPRRLLLVAIAFVLLAAHFLRAGSFALLTAALAAIALLAVRRPFAARAVQTALVLAALEWVRTLAVLSAERRAAGEPYLRMTFILAGVALATASTLLVFRSRTVKEHFRLRRP